MKTFFSALILFALSTTAAQAATVTITFDRPTQSGAPGTTLQFFGTITNTTASTVYLNADDLNPAAGFTGVDQFYNTVPISLAPGGNSGDIELFDIAVNSPFTGIAGPNLFTYDLVGGPDGGSQNNLGTAIYTVSAVAAAAATPEPSSVYLLLSGVSAAWYPVSRRLRARAS